MALTYACLLLTSVTTAGAPATPSVRPAAFAAEYTPAHVSGPPPPPPAAVGKGRAARPTPPQARSRRTSARTSHFTVHARNEYTCADARDVRPNCTRCLPGWLGPACQTRAVAQPCTLQRCLDWARCPWAEPLRVHVHATPTDGAAWLDTKTSAEYRNIVEALRSSTRAVADRREACLLVPWFDTLCAGNRCTDTWTDAPKVEALAAALEALPGWGDGSNHLVFDMSSAHAPTLPVNKAVYAVTSFWAAGSSFRHGFDQPVPLWNQRWQTENTPADAAGRRRTDRPLLLSFKGQRMFWCGSVLCAPADVNRAVHAGQLRELGSYEDGWVRNRLPELHNGVDIVVATECAREMLDRAMCDGDCHARCDADGRAYDALDFRELLRNSTFGLVLPGITPMSYRLAETLSYGAVPVIASDFIKLPFATLLDWHAFSIRISESQLLSLPELLRALPRARVASLQQNAVLAYERCFATPGRIALCAVEQLEVSMFGRLVA